jgi:hypothetical protein
MSKKILLFACAVVLLVPAFALAESPINLALFNPVQITKETESVSAFRFSLIYGRNADMQGLDLSLVGRNTGSFTGISWTGVGMVDGDFTGGQIGWLASITEGNMQGLQVGAYTKAGSGSSGVQWGIVNTADSFSGLQLGFVNIAESMRSGLQIGLVNIINNKDKLKVFPIVNWKF